MWLFGRHKHFSGDRLSEYLDGRLSAVETARIDRAVEECALCLGEMQSLRETRSLLQQLPQLELPRSFVFAQAPAASPVIPSEPRRPLVLRLPGWAYAGAASLAGVAAVLIVLTSGGGLWSTAGEEGFSGPLAMSEAPQQTASVHVEEQAQAPTQAPIAAAQSMRVAPTAMPEMQMPPPAGESMMAGQMAAEAPAVPQAASAPAPQPESAPAATEKEAMPTAVPAAMGESQVMAEVEPTVAPEAMAPTPTPAPAMAMAPVPESGESAAEAVAKGAPIPTPSPEAAAAPGQDVEPAAPIPTIVPTPSPDSIPDQAAPAAIEASPTATPAVAELRPTPAAAQPTPVPTVVSASPVPFPTAATEEKRDRAVTPTPFATSATPTSGAVGRMGPQQSDTNVQPVQEATPIPQIPQEKAPEPTAKDFVPPATKATEGEMAISGGQSIPSPGDSGPTQAPPVSSREGTATPTEIPQQAAADSGEEDTDTPASKAEIIGTNTPSTTGRDGLLTPQSTLEIPTTGAQEEALESGGAGLADNREAQEKGVLLLWIVGGVAVAIILAVLLVIGLRRNAAGRSPE